MFTVQARKALSFFSYFRFTFYFSDSPKKEKKIKRYWNSNIDMPVKYWLKTVLASAAFLAVSYTHLDVYKRQLQDAVQHKRPDLYVHHDNTLAIRHF